MIRLNVFFRVADPKDIAAATEIGNRLVNASLRDNGCVSYGMFANTLDPSVFIICETWTDDASLDSHSRSAHFTELVPQLEALSAGGLKLERFDK